MSRHDPSNTLLVAITLGICIIPVLIAVVPRVWP